MRRNLLFLLAATILLAVPAQSAVTNEESTDAEYLMNSGFSQVFAEDVFMQKNRVNGNTIEPLYEKNQNCLVRGWRKFYSAIDPSVDNADERLHHDVKLSPALTDL